MSTKTIINNRKHNLVTEHGTKLRPGENVLGEEKAIELIDSKQAQLWHRLRWIGVKPAPMSGALRDQIAEGATGEESTPPGPMSAKDAIAAVASESDVSVLEGMVEGEDRKTVLSAIERRLEELSGPADSGEGDDAGGEG